MGTSRESERSGLELEPLLSVKETAPLLGLPESSLYRLLADGRLRHVRIGGRRLIDPADVRAFIEEHKRGGDR